MSQAQLSLWGLRARRRPPVPPPVELRLQRALLQGKLPLSGKLPKEGTPVVKRGMVCLIGEGPDFFIAVGDHAEWGHAHTVWGEVHDMA